MTKALVVGLVMVTGVDKNVYVDPAIWTIERAWDFYDYPVTRSN